MGIEFDGTYDYMTGLGSCSVTVHAEDGVSGNYILHLVLVEDDLYYMGKNNYPDHESVMRDMIPDMNGTAISLSSNTSTTEVLNFTIPELLLIQNYKLVAFIQNPINRMVFNAAVTTIPEMVPITIPSLAVQSSNLVVLNDDGDQKLNPSESADLTVSVENRCDWAEASGVTGYLSSTSPFVSISDSLAFFDFIGACDSVTNTDDTFSLTVSDDAPDVADLELSIRLTANMDTGAAYEIVLPVDASMDLFQNNFPIAITKSIVSGNAAVDLDGDGMLEIIVGSTDNLLHAYTVNGTELAGFPFATGDDITGSPAIGDIDNDGDLEIVVSSRDKNLYVIQHDGSGASILEAASYLLGTPALDDLDGDGDLEIVVGGFGYDVIAVHHDGSSLPGFPVILDGERMSCGVSIADIDGDGSKDILVGTWGDYVHAFDLSGNSLTGFPVLLGDNVVSPSVVADMDLDGNPEILIGRDSGLFYAISNTGTVLWSYQLTTADIRNSAAVADFNNDGYHEVVIVATDGTIAMLDGSGNVMSGWPQQAGEACDGSPTLADLDGDGIPEIIVGSDGGDLYVFHADGTLMENFPLACGSPISGTPTIDDIDGDGDLELIVGLEEDLTVIDLKTPITLGSIWHTARGNYQRTGYYLYPLLSNDGEPTLPQVLKLEQNYPNPFNPTTTILFEIPENGSVTLTVYDLLGQEVSQLINSEMSPGSYSVMWQGLNSAEKPVESGVYFARINANGTEQVIKMMLLK